MMSTEIEFPYGDSSIKARIPTKNISFLLSSKYVKGLENEREAITNSLRSPIGCPPLRDRVTKNDKVVVLVTDNTRPCPDDRLLPPILAELEEKVPRENITIIIALGLHPPLNKDEIIKLLGRDIVENYNVVNHDVNQCVYIGTTSRGTPVDINTKVLEADFRISTGYIEPHFFAGFSGGRKSIAPGVFSVRSAYKNHGYKMIEHPRTRAGILKGNVFHEDLVEQAKMAKLDFIVNVLLNWSIYYRKREITHVVAGDFIKAHERGCELERAIAEVKVDHKVDISITTNTGAPLDLDLYQTCKGIDIAAEITRDGGIVIVASSCFAGVGPAAFREVHASCSRPIEVLQKVRREEPIGVQWENQVLARTQLKNDVYLVSNLEDSVVKDMMITPIRTIEEGLEKAFKVLGSDAEIAVIPEGPLVLPLLQN
ncbi:MAG: nickel-dependent lactate racemase [Dehalococcoidia bacterium]|nr:nickel-dependent lactate racemase [Dehalococcoidia bacterium]